METLTHPHLEGLIPVAVEAFLASTGQAHTVTQLQRDLTTTCMRAALQAALAALPGGGVDWRELIPANVSVSVDVSTGEHDAEHRIFALTTGEVMDNDGEPVILCIEESRNFNHVDACFACGRKIGRLQSEHEVDTRDGQTAYVGSECFKKIKAAGDEGWQPPKGGPRLFLLSPTPNPHEADQ